jgi:hypothetical protein
MTEQNYKVYNATQQEDHTTRLTYEEAVELASRFTRVFR